MLSANKIIMATLAAMSSRMKSDSTTCLPKVPKARKAMSP